MQIKNQIPKQKKSKILKFTLNLNMADEVSTGIKTTCLQYNSTGRSTFHIQVRNSSYFSFCFEVNWSSKKF